MFLLLSQPFKLISYFHAYLTFDSVPRMSTGELQVVHFENRSMSHLHQLRAFVKVTCCNISLLNSPFQCIILKSIHNLLFCWRKSISYCWRGGSLYTTHLRYGSIDAIHVSVVDWYCTRHEGCIIALEVSEVLLNLAKYLM